MLLASDGWRQGRCSTSCSAHDGPTPEKDPAANVSDVWLSAQLEKTQEWNYIGWGWEPCFRLLFELELCGKRRAGAPKKKIFANSLSKHSPRLSAGWILIGSSLKTNRDQVTLEKTAQISGGQTFWMPWCLFLLCASVSSFLRWWGRCWNQSQSRSENLEFCFYLIGTGHEETRFFFLSFFPFFWGGADHSLTVWPWKCELKLLILKMKKLKPRVRRNFLNFNMTRARTSGTFPYWDEKKKKFTLSCNFLCLRCGRHH